MAKTVIRLAMILAAAVFAPSQASAGEPQILGLIASLAPLPMVCDADHCSVEVSAFCLQQHAAVPERGTSYVLPAETMQRVTVAGQTSSGETVTIPSSHLRLVTARGNRAVQVSVGAAAVTELGLTSVALTIGDNVSAVPATLAAHADDPATAQEIALATGPLRQLGGRLVDHAGVSVDAARLLGRLVNAIPDTPVGDVPDRQELWAQVLEARASGPSVDVAHSRYGGCATIAGRGFITFRECLASQHDMLINPLNRSYWEAVDTGS